ncbi:MAG: hypothetical protein KKE17_15660 [Proteobacteria bacterium]|nr:hypothetical protein [Pseudomonadota bacterium]
MSANLNKIMVPVYLGKSPRNLGDMPFVTDDGMLLRAGDPVVRKPVHKTLNNIMRGFLDAKLDFEVMGCGIKVGKKQADGRIDSMFVMANVTDESFMLYVYKCPPDTLKPCTFKTDGAPIKGANSKSSRVMAKFDEIDDVSNVVAWAAELPGVFESGRRTCFNTGTVKKDKKDKKVKEPKTAKPANTKKPRAKLIQFPEAHEAPAAKEEEKQVDGEVKFTIGRRKKTATA